MPASENQPDLLPDRTLNGSNTAMDSLQAQVHSLRTLFSGTLVALIFLSLGVNFFIWRQMTRVRQQLDENSRIVAEYHRTTEPMVRDFLGKLEGFSVANQDFRPIISKYITPHPQPTPATIPKPPAK